MRDSIPVVESCVVNIFKVPRTVNFSKFKEQNELIEAWRL